MIGTAKSTPVQVLFSDYNDVWGPLSDMYWSQQASALISRHPISCVEEILTPYCPQCLSRYSEEEALLACGRCSVCKECPFCRCSLPSEANACGFCLEQVSPVISDLHDTILKKQENVFKMLLDSLKIGESCNDAAELQTSQQKVRGVWQLEQLNMKLERSINPDLSRSNRNPQASRNASVDISQAATAAAATAGVTAGTQGLLGVPLRSKRILRSKQDSRTGRMNILIQPKNLPLEGDSSLKLQKGKWWMKDSSAVQELPFISVARLPERQALVDKAVPCFVELCITNPKMADVLVVLSSRNTIGAECCEALPYLQYGRLGSSKLVHVVSTLAPLPCLSLSPPEEGDEKASLAIRIGGFEDELLKDVDDAGGAPPHHQPPVDADPADGGDSGPSIAPTAAQGLQQPRWTHRVIHNKAYVKIPVEVSRYVVSAPFELDLSCRVFLAAGSTSSVDLPFKVNF